MCPRFNSYVLPVTFSKLGLISDFRQATWRRTMAREQVRGAVNKVKGAVKDAVGKVTGSKKMQAEGKLDKAKGGVQNAAGDAKDKSAQRDQITRRTEMPPRARS